MFIIGVKIHLHRLINTYRFNVTTNEDDTLKLNAMKKTYTRLI